MDYIEKQRVIDSILWDKVITQNSTGKELILDTPSNEDRVRSNLIYDKLLQEATNAEMLNKEDALKIFGWTIDDETEIEGLKKDINNIKRGLLGYYPLHKSKIRQGKQLLRGAEKALLKRIIKKYNCFIYTSEHYASIESQKYLISRITKIETEQKDRYRSYWQTDCDFYNETDLDLIDNLRVIFFDEANYTEEVLREIARSEPWRSLWTCMKNTQKLLGSQNQRQLLYWSQVYDSIYDAYDRPAMEVINDDDLVDSWFIIQSEKMDKQSKEKSIQEKVKPGKAGGRQEVFVMSDKDGSKDIYEINSPINKARITQQQRLIKEKGQIEDQNLPVAQEQMRQQAVQESVKKTKNISRR